MTVGVRELKNNLSRFIRRVEQGERIGITAHNRVIAELVPPGVHTRDEVSGRFHELVAGGLVRTPEDARPAPTRWPDIRLPPGTAATLIDEDRGEA